MGVAYKRDIDDMRESPALDILLLLAKRGAKVSYSDPHVAVLAAGRLYAARRRLKRQRRTPIAS